MAIPSGEAKSVLSFRFIADTQSQRAKIKNPLAEQRSSPQGCTVKPEISAGQNALGFVFSDIQESPASELWPSISFMFCVKQRIHGLLVAKVMSQFYCGNK
jgi:hypothetical protein